MFSYASSKQSMCHPNSWTRAIPVFWTPGPLSSAMKQPIPDSVRELPLPVLQLLSKQESRLEGGRNIKWIYYMIARPDQELYMTEYTAIRIVFTL